MKEGRKEGRKEGWKKGTKEGRLKRLGEGARRGGLGGDREY